MKIVAALVEEEMGDEWGKLSVDEQRGLVKMWCVGWCEVAEFGK